LFLKVLLSYARTVTNSAVRKERNGCN
jgi:hypothetical protein